MAIVAAALIAPAGELTVELLEELRTLVPAAADTTAVAQAYADAGNIKGAALTDAARQDAAATAWAYHRAFAHRAQQILSGAMSASGDGEGGESYSTAQAQELKKDAARWLAAYEAEVAADAAESTPATKPVGSGSQTVRFGW